MQRWVFLQYLDRLGFRTMRAPQYSAGSARKEADEGSDRQLSEGGDWSPIHYIAPPRQHTLLITQQSQHYRITGVVGREIWGLGAAFTDSWVI